MTNPPVQPDNTPPTPAQPGGDPPESEVSKLTKRVEKLETAASAPWWKKNLAAMLVAFLTTMASLSAQSSIGFVAEWWNPSLELRVQNFASFTTQPGSDVISHVSSTTIAGSYSILVENNREETLERVEVHVPETDSWIVETEDGVTAPAPPPIRLGDIRGGRSRTITVWSKSIPNSAKAQEVKANSVRHQAVVRQPGYKGRNLGDLVPAVIAAFAAVLLAMTIRRERREDLKLDSEMIKLDQRIRASAHRIKGED